MGGGPNTAISDFQSIDSYRKKYKVYVGGQKASSLSAKKEGSFMITHGGTAGNHSKQRASEQDICSIGVAR